MVAPNCKPSSIVIFLEMEKVSSFVCTQQAHIFPMGWWCVYMCCFYEITICSDGERRPNFHFKAIGLYFISKQLVYVEAVRPCLNLTY